MTEKPNCYSSAVMQIIERIKKQPELAEHWNTMLNAEKNYFVGDLYNIVSGVNQDVIAELTERYMFHIESTEPYYDGFTDGLQVAIKLLRDGCGNK